LRKAGPNLKEAVELVLEANRTLAGEMMKGKKVIREKLSASGGMNEMILFGTWKSMVASFFERAVSTPFT